MKTRIKVLQEAEDISLVTLFDLKTALGFDQSDTTKDDQLELLIKWSSGEIATLCNRVFAQETIEETFRDTNGMTGDLYLSHYPIKQISSVTDNDAVLTEDIDFEVDVRPGKISSLTGSWTGPVVVSYVGGYELPFDGSSTTASAIALAQAAMLLTKEAYYAVVRGDATVRMIGHKETSIIYFDPNAALRMGAGGGGGTPGSGAAGSPAKRAVSDMLRHFMRFPV